MRKFFKFILKEHTGRVFRLQFDEFQIVSSSHDDTILIWDFLNYSQESADPPGNRNNGSIAMITNGGEPSPATARSPSR